jgi:hypothetical protein
MAEYSVFSQQRTQMDRYIDCTATDAIGPIQERKADTKAMRSHRSILQSPMSIYEVIVRMSDYVQLAVQRPACL